MKGRGKIINRLERATGKTVLELIEEATAFESLWEYSRRLSIRYYIDSPNSIARSLRRFIQDEKGKEWYTAYFTRGRHVLKRAGESIGVQPEHVIDHLIKHDIDLATLSREIDSINSTKIYNYLLSRISRHE